MLLFRHTLTIATTCCTVDRRRLRWLQSVHSRMSPPDWSREHGGASTLLLCLETSTGCQYDGTSHQHTCLKIVGLFYTTHFVDIFVQPRWTVGICIVPRIRIRLIGDRNFAVAGPRLWSSLSTALYCHSTCLRLLIWWRIMDCVIMCRL